MSILQKLFRGFSKPDGKPQDSTPNTHVFQAGDRAKDAQGNKHTVIKIDLDEHWSSGGRIYTIRDDGAHVEHGFNANSLTLLIESPTPGIPFQLGDRVGDGSGLRRTVIQIQPDAGNEQGGWITTISDDGRQFKHAIKTHGLALLPAEEKEFNPAPPSPIKEVRCEGAFAGVYLREGKLFFHGRCYFTRGQGYGRSGRMTGPFRCLDFSVSDAELGEALLSVLSDSREEPPVHAGENGLQELCNLAGLSRKSAFVRFEKNALCCSVEQMADEIRVRPMCRDRGGFVSIGGSLGEDVVVRGYIPATVGQVLREGLSRSENRYISKR